MLELVALRLLCAVAQPHIYSETVVIAACAGGEIYRQKEKAVKHPGMESTGGRYVSIQNNAAFVNSFILKFLFCVTVHSFVKLTSTPI